MPATKAETLKVPPLKSGGLMLGYQCNQSCRHCSYRSSPEAGEWMHGETLERAVDVLAGERRLSELHLGGGEATLNPGLLEKTVRLCREKGIRLSYLETNGFYASSVEKAKEVLSPLRDAGLTGLLVSVSPYHNEFIPLKRTLNCLDAAFEVFGEDAVFPWLGHFIPMLSKMDPEKTHSLEEFLAANELRGDDPALLRLFPLTPGGRVPERLRPFFNPMPADAFAVGHCLETITEVSHFHVDPYGNLFTGHCPGIVSGRLDDMHGEKNMDDHPVFVTLALGGPHALMRLAKEKCGFKENPEGYISPCDLCFQVRKTLIRNDSAAWPELGPKVYYRD